jgi:hypothetical protein
MTYRCKQERRRYAQNQKRSPDRSPAQLTFLPVTSAILDQTVRTWSVASAHSTPLLIFEPPLISRILTNRPSALKEDEQAHAQTQLGIRGAQLFSKLFECWVVDRCAERRGQGGKGDHDEDDGLCWRAEEKGGIRGREKINQFADSHRGGDTMI